MQPDPPDWRYERLQQFFITDCDKDDFCASLTTIERGYTAYLLANTDEIDDINQHAIWLLREMIEQARAGFTYQTFAQLIEGAAATHTATLSTLQQEYFRFVIGDINFKGSPTTRRTTATLDAFLALLTEIGQ